MKGRGVRRIGLASFALAASACTAMACGARTPLGLYATEDGGTAAGLDAGAPDARVDAPLGKSAVHGTWVLRYFADSGEIDRPNDLSGARVRAIIDHGGDALEVMDGAGRSDGTFAIDGVPDGAFALVIDGTMVMSPARELTLSSYIAGRPGVDRSPKPLGRVSLGLSNMAPLSDPSDAPPTTFFTIVSTNAACTLTSRIADWQPPPTAGATSIGALAPLTADCAIDPSRGDLATLIEHVVTDARTPELRTLDAPGFRGPSGGTPPSISGRMNAAPTVRASFDIRASTLTRAILLAGGPQPTIRLGAYERPPVSPYAGPQVGIGCYGCGADVIADDVMVAATVPDPFPGWSKMVRLDAVAKVKLPRARGAPDVSESFDITRVLDWKSATEPTAIALAPPLDVRLAGAAPRAPVDLGGRTARWTWKPPMYFPSGLLRYAVAVIDIDSGDVALTITTKDTSAFAPPGALLAGHQYVAEVSSFWTYENVDYATRPLDGDVTEFATVPSSVFVP